MSKQCTACKQIFADNESMGCVWSNCPGGVIYLKDEETMKTECTIAEHVPTGDGQACLCGYFEKAAKEG